MHILVGNPQNAGIPVPNLPRNMRIRPGNELIGAGKKVWRQKKSTFHAAQLPIPAENGLILAKNSPILSAKSPILLVKDLWGQKNRGIPREKCRILLPPDPFLLSQ